MPRSYLNQSSSPASALGNSERGMPRVFGPRGAGRAHLARERGNLQIIKDEPVEVNRDRSQLCIGTARKVCRTQDAQRSSNRPHRTTPPLLSEAIREAGPIWKLAELRNDDTHKEGSRHAELRGTKDDPPPEREVRGEEIDGRWRKKLKSSLSAAKPSSFLSSCRLPTRAR